MKALPSVEIKYGKDNCEKNPFIVIFEAPLSGFDLYLIEFPDKIRYDIMNSLDLILSEYYFDEVKCSTYTCYS